MSDRLAFAPLKSLETALDLSVQQRARVLFETGKARTARGSGHELDKNIAGNSTAMASACLLLAKTELEGESAEDLEVHQRHAMITKPQFRLLVASLQSVLDLRSSAKTAFTPTRGSARKRKAEAQDAGEELVTPSRSSRNSKTTIILSKGSEVTTTPTRSTSRRSVRTTASLRDLATASHQKLRRKADEDLSTDRTVTTSPQLLARSPINNANAESPLPDTPSKSIAKGKQKATEAFENAMNQITPTKTKPALNATPAKAQIDYSKPYEVLKVDANPTDKPDTEEIPYETFWGDMLVRYRRKEDMDARRQKMEIWKISMLQKLMATS